MAPENLIQYTPSYLAEERFCVRLPLEREISEAEPTRSIEETSDGRIDIVAHGNLCIGGATTALAEAGS